MVYAIRFIFEIRDSIDINYRGMLNFFKPYLHNKEYKTTIEKHQIWQRSRIINIPWGHKEESPKLINFHCCKLLKAAI